MGGSCCARDSEKTSPDDPETPQDRPQWPAPPPGPEPSVGAAGRLVESARTDETTATTRREAPPAEQRRSVRWAIPPTTFPAVRVAPDPKYVAEVVVLLSTLGARRSEFNAGRRIRDILEIKRVHHKVVDFNRDARLASTPEAQLQHTAIQRLMAKDKLRVREDGDLILPQVFIDGSYCGDAQEIQGMEDDGVLSGVLTRRLCVSCIRRRTAEEVQCHSCRTKFEEILPGVMRIDDLLKEIARTEGYDYEDSDEEEEAHAARGTG